MSKYEFTLKETDGKDISLSDFKGKNVVLYFYPKDDTPGWNNEANDFKDLYDQFKEENTVILGVSKDSLESHKKFREKFGLPFLLLSDEGGKVGDKFAEEDGKGVGRSTFIFNKDGELVKDLRNIKVEGHAKEVLEYIKEM